MNDCINLGGQVTIYQEDDDGNRTYICKNKQNHFTNAMIKGMCSFLLGSYLYTSFGGVTYTCNTNPKMYLGTDLLTPTNASVTELISKINVAPTITNVENLQMDNDNFNYKITSTWQHGSISGTIGELGLYLNPFTDVNINWYRSGSYTYPVALCARYAVADGNMESFEIDTSKSLVIQWNIGVNYE